MVYDQWNPCILSFFFLGSYFVALKSFLILVFPCSFFSRLCSCRCGWSAH